MEQQGLTLKQRLAQKNRKLFKTIDVDGDAVDLRRPSHKERLHAMKLSETAGEIDASNKPTTMEGGLRFVARVVATVMYEPKSKLRLYDPAESADVETIMGAPWFEDVMKDAQVAFKGSLKEDIEEARGNS
ncbi:hypothetical protein [Corallococcus macrosporus]|uniref:Phage tail assembly chaperone n=1 Tax=Myxococcus fulvus (strain ATCC BAA-855 / HW-1) TaxID=483219 RepID=F8C7Y9_MYXFH|nr:hypothetical protein [Corallococcus macrosporus]AEI66941.1 phage tail assembly chaperone [Corallococcus macrosporus]